MNDFEKNLKEIDCSTNSELCNKNKYFKADKVFIGNKICENAWEIGAQIGSESSIGNVFNTCCRKDCNYVAKIINFNTNYTQNNFINEINLQYKFSKIDIAPKVYEAFLDKKTGIFIMDPMKATADFLIKEILDEDITENEKILQIEYILDNIIRLLSIMHDKGYWHGDTHLNNFMLSIDNQWKVIDFGKCALIEVDEFEIDYETLMANLFYIILADYSTISKNIKKYLYEKYNLE
jgi:tRNA A-37 threonylcarbamoyl transferase component Bud32